MQARQEISTRILDEFDALREWIPSGTYLWRLLPIVADLLGDDSQWTVRPLVQSQAVMPTGRGHPRVPRKVTVYARKRLRDAGVVDRDTQTLLLRLVGLYHGRTSDV